MKALFIKQINQVNREMEMTSLTRHASEVDDVRVEGQGISIRLPFLPTLQRLLFQDESTIDFYRCRIKKFRDGNFQTDGFDSPVALFNFLVPSYHLTTLNADIVESDFKIRGFEQAVSASSDEPAFIFLYRTSKYRINSEPIMLDVVINSTKCYATLWSGLEGAIIANCLVECALDDSMEIEPIPY